MTRWWGVALLSLSVGLNLGLVIAVVQQRFAVSPAPSETTKVAVTPTPEVQAVVAPSSTPVVTAGTTGLAPSNVAPSNVQPVGPEWTPPIAPRGEPALPPTPHRPEGRPRPGGEARQPDPTELTWAEGPGQGAGGEPLAPVGPPPSGLGGGGPSPAKLEEVAQRLGVPPEDRPRFIALQRTFLAEARLRRIELEGVRRLLQAELVAPSPDRQRLRELVESSARLQGRLEGAFVEHVLAARELLDGEAERRYLHFLSRLGPRVMLGGPPPGPGRQGDPRWQAPKRGGGWGLGGGQMRRRNRWPEPRPSPPQPAPSSPAPAPTNPASEGGILQASSSPPSFGAR